MDESVEKLKYTTTYREEQIAITAEQYEILMCQVEAMRQQAVEDNYWAARNGEVEELEDPSTLDLSYLTLSLAMDEAMDRGSEVVRLGASVQEILDAGIEALKDDVSSGACTDDDADDVFK
jgi:hypothetical protein